MASLSPSRNAPRSALHKDPKWTPTDEGTQALKSVPPEISPGWKKFSHGRPYRQTPNPCTERKNPGTRAPVGIRVVHIHDSMFAGSVPKRPVRGDRKQGPGCPGVRGKGNGAWPRMETGFLSPAMTWSGIRWWGWLQDSVVRYTHGVVPWTWMNCTVCELYLSKAVKEHLVPPSSPAPSPLPCPLPPPLLPLPLTSQLRVLGKVPALSELRAGLTHSPA